MRWAMATVARVIELYGEAYWPILERLEAELEDMANELMVDIRLEP